jgi:hypothetical protein
MRASATRTCGILAASLGVALAHAAQWETQAIGDGAKGDAEFAGDEITVTAVTGDIWDAADTAMYVYRETSGNMEISARVADYTPSNPDWGKAGLMIRQSVDADAANAFINLTGANGLKLIYRDTQGGPTTPGDGGADYDLPLYIKLTRVGDTITAFTSKDGDAWAEAPGGVGPAADIPMVGTIVAGIALSSNSPDEAEVVLDSVDGTDVFTRAVEPQGKLAIAWANLKTQD